MVIGIEVIFGHGAGVPGWIYPLQICNIFLDRERIKNQFLGLVF